MREELKLSYDGGDSGKKYKHRYGGVYVGA
jgi:hypothetical protein